MYHNIIVIFQEIKLNYLFNTRHGLRIIGFTFIPLLVIDENNYKIKVQYIDTNTIIIELMMASLILK